MPKARTVLENVLGSAISASLPILSRIPDAQMLRMMTPLPVEASTKRELATRNASFLNVLRHLESRRETLVAKERIKSYIINPVIVSHARRATLRRLNGIAGLSSVIITPAVECNLDCRLCYNKHHADMTGQLSLETMDRVVKEARALGAYRASIIGGEPLLGWQKISELVRLNPEVLFTIMTNGVLLTDEMVEAFSPLSNVELCFSIDGPREINDELRGADTFDRVLDAMDLYRSAGGMVLYSPTITSANFTEVLSDEFVDLMIEKGAYMAYHHNYYLVGGQDDTNLLLSTDQRRWISRRILEIVESKPIAIFDNVHSRLFKGGCQAAREYVHINHMGCVEPCCMVQFSRDSVHEKPLAEILGSEFFAHLNAIRPDASGIRQCLVGQNSSTFEEIVDRDAAKPTAPCALDVFSPDRAAHRSLMPTCFGAS